VGSGDYGDVAASMGRNPNKQASRGLALLRLQMPRASVARPTWQLNVRSGRDLDAILDILKSGVDAASRGSAERYWGRYHVKLGISEWRSPDSLAP
jgi:hypothetical protein